MKNLLDKSIASEIIARINQVKDDTTPLWGKMNAGQMMAHCQLPLKVALGEISTRKNLIGILFRPWVRKMGLNDKPYKRGLPTDKAFLVSDERDFEVEKERLKQLIIKFQNENSRIGKQPHPFFGRMSCVEWGTSMYKHLDHHLQQFGV